MKVDRTKPPQGCGADPDEMNAQRAEWALTALNAFRRETACDPGTETLHDLLVDLRHWADRSEIPWSQVLGRAMDSYQAEIAQ